MTIRRNTVQILLASLLLAPYFIPLSTVQAHWSGKYNAGYQQINTRNNEGNTPLNVAIKQGNDALVRQLVQQGADPNIRDNEGNTPLNVAIKRGGNFSAVMLLLQGGADPNIRDNEGNTPLNVAVKRYYGYDTVVKLLLQHGADPNIRDNEGNTPLAVATRRNRTDIRNQNNILTLLRNAGAQF